MEEYKYSVIVFNRLQTIVTNVLREKYYKLLINIKETFLKISLDF